MANLQADGKVQSGLVEQLNNITSSQEWANTSPSERLSFLNIYNKRLYDYQSKAHPGGWEQYEIDGSESLKYLDKLTKQSYVLAQEEINNKRNQWFKEGVKNAYRVGKDPNIAEYLVGNAGALWNEANSHVAKLLGFDDAAEDLANDARLIRDSSHVINNAVAAGALKARDKNRLEGIFYDFVKGFVPFTNAEDQKLLEEHAKRRGITENIFEAAGSFVPVAASLALLPATGGASTLAYSTKYAVASGMAYALTEDISELDPATLGTVMGLSFAGMTVGSKLSNWVKNNLYMARMLTKLPAAAHKFALERVADIGETLSDTAYTMIRTGDFGKTLAALPGSIGVNMLEEMLIDLFPGRGGSKADLITGHMYQLHKLKLGAESKKQTLIAQLEGLGKNDPKRKRIEKSIDAFDKQSALLDEAYSKRRQNFIDYVQKNPDEAKKYIAADPQTYKEVYDQVLAETGDTTAAQQAGVNAVVMISHNTEAVRQQQIDDMGVMERTKTAIKKQIHNIRTFGQKKPQSLQQWVKSLPQEAQNVISVSEGGEVEVNKEAYRLAYGKEYNGEKVLGKVKRINDEVFAELASNAPMTAQYEEAFHIAQELLLSKEEQTALNRAIGKDYESQAKAYAEYRKHQDARGIVGNAFKKIHDFTRKVREMKAGAIEASTVFDRVATGDVKLQERREQTQVDFNNTHLEDSILTKDGPQRIVTTVEQDYPKAEEDNVPRMTRFEGGEVAYAVPLLDHTSTGLIEDSLNSMTEDHNDRLIRVTTFGTEYLFSLSDYRKTNSLSETIDGRAETHAHSNPEYYSVEDPKLVEKAQKDARLSSLENTMQKIPLVKELFTEYTNTVPDMGLAEEWIKLPHFAGKDWPELAAIIKIQTDRENERAIRNEKLFARMKAFDELSYDSYTRVAKWLWLGDADGKDYTKDDLMDKFGSVTDLEWQAYDGIRLMMNESINEQIKHAKRQREFFSDDWMRELLDDETMKINGLDKVNDVFKERIAHLESLKNRGYMPRSWFGGNGITFFVRESNKADAKKAVRAIEKITGRNDLWDDRAENYDFVNEKEDLHFRIHFRRQPLKVNDNFEQAQEALKENGFLPEPDEPSSDRSYYRTEPTGQDSGDFNDVSMQDFRELFDKVMSIAESKAKTDNQKKVLTTLSDSALEFITKTQGWSRRTLERGGTLGYNTDATRESIVSYITGLTGMITKSEAGMRFDQALENIDPKKKRLKRYATRLVKHVMRNSTEYDRLAGLMTSAIFTKHLGFNLPFHLRNRFQPWYMGLPVMNMYGISTTEAVKQLAKAQKDLFGTEAKFYRGAKMTEAQGFADSILPNSAEDSRVLSHATANGIFGSSLADSAIKKTVFHESQNRFTSFVKKVAGITTEHSGRFVSVSDNKNRTQVLLAAYRALRQEDRVEPGKFDEVAYEQARMISDEANVIYKGWNTLPIFMADSPLRYAKPLFMFQKYGWHLNHLMYNMAKDIVIKKQFGPLLQMLFINMLLGGVSTLPFWDNMKKAFGYPEDVDMRNNIIKALGGKSVLLRMLDTGAFGFVGMDMRNSLSVRPLKALDPLFGNHAMAGMWRDFGNTYDQIRRGRIQNALAEGVLAPGFLKKIHKSIREAMQGKTTYKGDVILDFDGKPLRLTAYETTLSMMGFMPVRMGMMYSASKASKDFTNYWREYKSRLGTKYKIARISKDRDEIAAVEREIEEFNRELGLFKTKPTNEINDSTRRNWLKGAGTKRNRQIAKEYLDR